jgi:integrase
VDSRNGSQSVLGGRRGVAQYVSILARLNKTFGSRRLADVRPSDVSYYVTKMGATHAAASVSRNLSILHAIYEWAVALELVDRNPTRGVERPAVRQRKGHALRSEQVQALSRSFTDDQDRVAFLTLVLTGVRRSELQALQWRDVDLIENRLRVVDSKTETGERSIAIPPGLAEALWQHRRTTAYKRDGERVFCDPGKGSVYDYRTFSAALRAAYKRAGLEWEPRKSSRGWPGSCVSQKARRAPRRHPGTSSLRRGSVRGLFAPSPSCLVLRGWRPLREREMAYLGHPAARPECLSTSRVPRREVLHDGTHGHGT